MITRPHSKQIVHLAGGALGDDSASGNWVNLLTATGKAAGDPSPDTVLLNAFGSSANISVNIVPKGTGNVAVSGFPLWHSGNLANPMTLDTVQTVTGAKQFSAGVFDSLGNVRLIPQLVHNGDYTFVLGDLGQHHAKTDSAAHAWTIPPNSSVPFPIGTALTIVNLGGTTANITLTRGAGVALYKNGTNGNVAVAPGTMITALKVGTDVWQV